ncbi:MAG: DUF6424 family protein [Pseudomonadota bacterium]
MPKTKVATQKTAKAVKAVKAAAPAKNTTTLKEDNPFGVYYSGHEPRADSPLYAKSRKLMNSIAKSSSDSSKVEWFYGGPAWEDHHGGGLWVHDGQGWFFVKNFAGMEWASQFCADPKKVEQLRQNAERLYQGIFYANTKSEMLKLQKDYPFDAVLKTPITDSDLVAQWCDSIFNASVPLPKLRHTGLSPKGHGVHHYPTPVTDIELFKHDDFILWVKDDENAVAAVLPIHPRGVDPQDPEYKKNYGKTTVTYATPGTRLGKLLDKANKDKRPLVAGANNPMTVQAFKEQS